ncbi:DNA processing protein [Anoxybacillus tengchongensis]|uniref:DNA processing protein n=1 Tax=Anoxybacillus tengchongensis TaxID=576944 RepID=A0A7W9YNF1_9BACL|nr:DNA-processing protein DprA [Anoxybacillus tengchongensis]MBB6175200.1 DNA processing protein [Anoxybacillus tengchongensis]
MRTLWLAFTFVRGLGAKRIKNIYDTMPQLTENYFHDDEQKHILMKVIKNKNILDVLFHEKTMKEYIKQAQEVIWHHQKQDINVITIGDEYYPKLLKKLDDPPIALYCKGNIELLQTSDHIAIVGTRHPTEIGKKFARRIAEVFVEKGYCIVSGLAIGIDTEAHIGTLDAKGKTVAVLAGGLHSIFPKENTNLAHRIIENGGVLISEQAIGSPAFRAAFVQRDRIQSGLSLAVCPVQTDIEGGTQNTIQFARKQNRLLFCPVPIENVPATRGIFKLLEEDAIPLKTSSDLPYIIQNIENKKVELLEDNKQSSKPILNCKTVEQLNLFD